MVGVAEQGRDLDVDALGLHGLPQFAVYRVQRQFGHFEQHQAPRLAPQDLSADFGPDGPPRTGDHDHLVADAGIEQMGVRRHGVAAQQVRDIDLADFLRSGLSGEDFGEVGQRADMEIEGFEPVQDFLLAAARGRRQGQQHAGNAAVADERGQYLGREDFHAVDEVALQAGLVIDERDGAAFLAAGQRSEDPGTGVACTVDHDAFSLMSEARVEGLAHRQATAAHVQQRERPVDHQYGGRDRDRRRGKVVKGEDCRGDTDPADDRVHRARA